MTQQVRKSYRNHRQGTWAAVLVVLVAAVAVMLIGAAGSASGAADKKNVSATISPPGPWSRGATVSAAALSITNSSGSQQLGSADLCIPNALTGVTGAVATSADSPCAGISTKVVKLRNLAIAPGVTSSIELGSITVPCTAPDSVTWKLFAKQSNDFSGLPGNNFTPYPFSFDVTINGACTLTFQTQPSQTSNILDPSTSPATSYPLVAEDGTSAIQVLATTGGGTPVQGVSISIASTATTTSSGGPAATSTSGVASFPSLRVGPDGGEYTLTASAPGFTSVTSNGFFVFTQQCVSSPCTVNKQTANDTNVSVTQSGFSGPIGILVDTNGGAANQCTGGTPTGDDFRVEIRPLQGNTEITWRYTKSKRLKEPTNGQTYELCVGSKFDSSYTGTLSPDFPVQMAFDPDGNGKANNDGTGRYWGVLTDAASSTKCDSNYSYPYPTKIAEYANGADAIQVACFPYPFDPQGFGVG